MITTLTPLLIMSERHLPRTVPVEARQLPDRFELQHAVAFHFHDVLATLVTDLGESGVFWTHLEMPDEDWREIEELAGEDLWDWLIANDYEEVVYDQAYRQVTAAVTADACNFLYEALVCSGKGKTAVAYSLLRKPLKENLLLLEWLSADPVDFLDTFHGESVWDYTPNRLTKERRLEIMSGALNNIDGSVLFDEDDLWRIRYSKQEPRSLEYMWTKATHLVTTKDVLATTPTNLNFVFSSQQAVEEQWEYFYEVVPVLLDYMVHVVESVLDRLIRWNAEKRDIQRMLRTLALYRSIEEGTMSRNATMYVDDLLASLNEAGLLRCERCAAGIPIDRPNADRLWSKAKLKCLRCGKVFDFWGAVFGEVQE